MMNIKIDNKGISLPMTIGLLLLLVALTATVNELVIRALRASHQIEASDKAYFAAEGGIEDALYELSAHTAGYETGSLGTLDARNDSFSQSGVVWRNEWEIKNRDLSPCTATTNWWEYNPNMCGQIRKGEKLVFNLFKDDAVSLGVPDGGINETSVDIQTIALNNMKIAFRLPPDLVAKYPGAFSDSKLHIDNDGDLNASTESGPEGILGLNEDGAEAFGYSPNVCGYSGGVAVDDDDCDLLEDEDSPEDPVVVWRIVDGNGNTFQPLRGCKNDPVHPSHPGRPNGLLCEKNFTLFSILNEVSVSFSELDWGINQDGSIVNLQTFLLSYAGNTETLQMEFLVASSLEAVSLSDGSKIPIPYLEYGFQYNAIPPQVLPDTFFAIRADGYYQDFKQSITTNVVPRATTQLLDLTIIQQ